MLGVCPGGLFPISSSLTHPATAHLITDYAKAVNAGLLLHTANLSQNSLPWLNNGIQHLGFPGEARSPICPFYCLTGEESRRISCSWTDHHS